MAETNGGFDLPSLVALLSRHAFQTIAIQFPDEFIHLCTQVYEDLALALHEDTFVYIITDSTFGSSVDDISAAHVNAEVLIYFGSDLSSSGSIPVIVVPFRRAIDIPHCVAALLSSCLASGRDENRTATTILCMDPEYFHAGDELVKALSSAAAGVTSAVVLAQTASCANLEDWSPETLKSAESSRQPNQVSLGNLTIPATTLGNPFSICYIGNNKSQLQAIMLKLPSSNVTHYNPLDKSCTRRVGEETKEFTGRYGGISRVKDANIIGIIVGSMGLTGELTRTVIKRLQTLISAAGKHHYTFVMGRLNEAKLCNFPEIDLFCMIANDSCSVIQPK